MADAIGSKSIVRKDVWVRIPPPVSTAPSSEQPKLSSASSDPILLLHDGTRGEHGDVLCLRINTVKPKHRQDTTTWRKVENHEHPFFFHLPKDPRYGLPEESVIALASVGAINKSAIVRLAPRGELNIHEMQIISERLHSALALDLARQLAARAKAPVARLAQRSQPEA